MSYYETKSTADFVAFDKIKQKEYEVKMINFETNCFSIKSLDFPTWIHLDAKNDVFKGRIVLYFENQLVKKLSLKGIEVE